MEKYIVNGLQAYIDGQNFPWHMPGHKRKGFNFKGRHVNVRSVISEVYGMDVTEVYGLDDLHMPEGMIDKSQKELAGVYNTFASYYLVNGATCGIMTAIAATHAKKLIVAKNCHKSVINTVQLLGLEAVYIEPERLEIVCGEDGGHKSEIYGSIDMGELEAICAKQDDIGAMVITSPTYEGIISDIYSISKILHRYGILLIVDEAHGAHLPFMYKNDGLSAIPYADLVVQSLHKTLPAMTQTALLHVINPLLDKAVQKYKSIFMSSSPSYVMLSSMELAVDWACSYDYGGYLDALADFRQRAAGLKNIVLFPESLKNRDIAYDSTRIVFCTKEYGTIVEEKLRQHGIICEMSGIHHIVLISTPFDSVEDFDYLYEVLKDLDKDTQVTPGYSEIEWETEKIKGLLGTFAEDDIYVYPPGSCIAVKGEVIEQEDVDILLSYYESGKIIRGL
ncbi:MAG: aminotransferase class I/II-fold pyridoxal phosphate-dependent enzyme [Lachnospiraceae bacterium]|nr:aminotransferase class I/II-fold pyridoxal phosphate-dependent enzyme [Lachnospiraceae bacterium]